MVCKDFEKKFFWIIQLFYKQWVVAKYFLKFLNFVHAFLKIFQKALLKIILVHFGLSGSENVEDFAPEKFWTQNNIFYSRLHFHQVKLSNLTSTSEFSEKLSKFSRVFSNISQLFGKYVGSFMRIIRVFDNCCKVAWNVYKMLIKSQIMHKNIEKNKKFLNINFPVLLCYFYPLVLTAVLIFAFYQDFYP